VGCFHENSSLVIRLGVANMKKYDNIMTNIFVARNPENVILSGLELGVN
jgi:hypothetical protein